MSKDSKQPALLITCSDATKPGFDYFAQDRLRRCFLVERRADRLDFSGAKEALQHLRVQLQLVAKVIVHESAIYTGASANVADGCPVIPDLGKNLRGCVQQPLTGGIG